MPPNNLSLTAHQDASQGLGEASTAQHAPAAGSPPPLATTDIILKVHTQHAIHPLCSEMRSTIMACLMVMMRHLQEVAHVLSESIATGVCKADDAQQLGCAAAPVSTTVPPQPSLLSGTAEQRHELDTTLPPSAHEVQECQPALSTPQTAPGEAGARSDTELITPPVVPADHDSSSDEAAAPDEGLHAVDAEDDAEETALPPARSALLHSALACATSKRMLQSWFPCQWQHRRAASCMHMASGAVYMQVCTQRGCEH